MIILKNVKTFETNDGYAFSASVYVDGIKAFIITNSGNGGCNDYDIINKELYNKVDKLAIAKYTEFSQEQIDCYLEDVLNEYETNKKLKRLCNNKTVFHLPEDKEGKYRNIKGNYCIEIKEFILNKYPTAIIVNEKFETLKPKVVAKANKGKGKKENGKPAKAKGKPSKYNF